MSKEPGRQITRVEGTGVPVRGKDIDTDQIIPGRFLKVVTFEGIGQYAFFDQRFDEDDNPKDHPFNEPHYQKASILIVNDNFGCGSSREHAPQALMRWGIDAIIGESFADIFAGNCVTMGIPTVTADRDDVTTLQDEVEADPSMPLTVDIEAGEVVYEDTRIEVHMDDAQRRGLVEGEWDTLSLMHNNADATRDVAASLPYLDLDA